ncbi:hypothetical protein GmHk_20G056918 [Glycine max]|nr:hypothetical protein GmHk_20G056918 [Glycine max]
MHGKIRPHRTRGCSANVTGKIVGTVFATLTGDFGAEGASKVQRAYMINSVITILYSNGRVYEEIDGKYVALQICDDEDVETMIESFQQQDQMSILELYIEKDVVGGYMFHCVNSLTSCENNLSNNEAEPPRIISNLHGDEDDDYLVSNSYVEESLDEDDGVDGISNIDDEVTNMIQPVRIVHPTEGIIY